jgi:hypothetical protein
MEPTKGNDMNKPGWWVVYAAATVIFATVLYWLAHIALWIGRGLTR